jgi:hypothetical protein
LGPTFGTTVFGDGDVKGLSAMFADECGGVLDSAEAAGTGLAFETEVVVCGEGMSLVPVMWSL